MILVMTRLFKILLVLVSVAGCAAIPAPLVYMGYAKNGADIVQIIREMPTTSDLIMSELSNRICNTSNWLKGKDYCIEKSLTPIPVTVEELPPLLP